MFSFNRIFALVLALATAVIVVGCGRSASEKQSVVLYTSVDEPYVRPLVQQFEKETGITVTLVTDAEASKSVGLAEKLRAEKDHPKADVWWSNECFLTIGLAGEGILAPYDSPVAADIPATYKDPDHLWAGSVLRVRMLVSSPGRAGATAKPTRLVDMLRPEFKGKIALARPTAGTTGGHVAALDVLWGANRATSFFQGLHDNGVTLVGGNSVVAESVARGDMWVGVCDNDDAADAASSIGKLDAVLPDQGEGEDGTLAMPCTAGLVANAQHPDAAKRLIDYLLSKTVDQKLVNAKFAWCSTRDASGHGRFMQVDYRAVAKAMPGAIRAGTAILEGRPNPASMPATQPFAVIPFPSLPNARHVTSKVMCGGLPEGEQGFKDLAALGVKTVISVDGILPDIEMAHRYGMTYVHLPFGYGGVPEGQAMAIAKAIDEYPGPIYVHCHHGMHRSPAAVAVACVYNGTLPPAEAEQVLKAFGTGANYLSLWQSARDARPKDAGTLRDLKVDFVERAKIPPLAEAMVAVDHVYDHLKLLQKGEWKVPKDHPDLDPSHEALQLRELLTEIGRSDAIKAKPAEFQANLGATIEKANALQLLLASGAPNAAAATETLRLLTTSCAKCHASYRD